MPFFLSLNAFGVAGDEFWDGSFDFQGLDGQVNAIAVSGTNVYVGGTFTRAGSLVVNGIARWDGTAWHALGDGTSGTVEAIAIDGNNVYVGGDFLTVGILVVHNVARWDGSGWNPVGTGTSRTVRSLAVGPSGEVYAGGDFSTAGSIAVRRIGKWNGTSWSAMGAGANDSVYAIAVSGTNVYIGGFFDDVDGVLTTGIARWNGTSWSAVGGGVDIGVTALALNGSDLYVGGFFFEAGGSAADNIARWNGSNWFTVGGGLDDAVNGLAVAGANIYAAGDFLFTGTTPLNRIAKLTNNSWSGLGGGMDDSAYAVGVSGQNVYVGGLFTKAGGTPSLSFARYNAAVPRVTIVATDATAAEPGSDTGTFTITRTGSTAAALTVKYTVGGTATPGTDYFALSGTATIPIGAASTTITVTPKDDLEAECDETVIVGIAPSTAYNTGPNATVTILDNETRTVGIVATDPTASEPGVDTGLFTVSRMGCTNTDLVVNFTVTGSATAGSDYVALGSSVTIPAGSLSVMIQVTPLNDLIAEGPETVLVTLAAGAYAIDPTKSSATVTINDDEVQGLTVSPSAISVPEGGTASFTVRLNVQPQGSVMVTTAFGTGDTDLSVTGGAALTFTSANWNTPQTVTVSAAEDPDAANGSTTFNVTSAGVPTQMVTATEADNDSLDLLVSLTAVTVPEGGTGTFTVRLTAQPEASLTVTVSRSSGDGDLNVTTGATLTFTTANWSTPQTVTISGAEATLTVTVSRSSGDGDLNVTTGATLTFTTANWSTPQTVTIAGAEDADAVNGSAIFTVASTGLTSRTVTATEVDNDTLDLLVSTSTLTVPEGGSASFTVKLTAQPQGDTVVNVARTSGDSDLTVAGGAALTFTMVNWNTPQTVTIAAAEDADAVGGSAVITVSSTGFASKTVTATEADNDTLGIVVSSTAITVSEGSSSSFTVKLSAQPQADTVVSVTRASGDTDLSVTGGASLTFTVANWNTPQTVTISAAEDADAVNSTAIFSVASSGLPTISVTATEADNDTQNLVVSPTSITVPEGGTTAFTVKLSAQPVTDVTVSVTRTSGDTDLTISSAASLTFTTANWNSAQTVTVAAAEDADAVNGTATITVASTGLPSQTVTATEADNDTQALILSTSSITVVEGSSTSFTIRLGAQPVSDTIVTVTRTSGDTDLTVGSGASLTFTTANWNTPQTVTINAAEDLDAVNSTAVFTVAATGIPSQTVTAMEGDNDTQGLVVTPTAVTVPEGSTATFTVRLSAQPLLDTPVTITRASGDTDLTVSSSAMLTFTSANWNTPQTVTLGAAEDPDAVNGTATFTVASGGLPSQTVTATEGDNDTLDLVLSTSSLSVPEGSSSTFTVKLGAQPPSTVTVSVTRSSGDTDLTISGGASLTFTTSNWNTPQTVTVNAAEDPDAINGTAVLTISASGLPSKTLTATEADNDTLNLVVPTSSIIVNEGGNTTFTVSLSAQPAGNTTVTVTRTSGDTDLTVSSGASLTFTTSNWSTPQTVTIAAAEDPDAVNGTATFTIASTGLSSQLVTATENDNDTQALIVSTTAITVVEGSSASFTVKLGAQPLSTTTVTVTRSSGDTDLTVSIGATLTFTTSNWNTAQPVTIAAAEDADAANGSATFVIATSGLPSQTVTATEADNDSQGLVVTPMTVTVPEGGTSSFTVRLSAQPVASTTVTVTRSSGDTDLTVSSGASLTFSTSNWNTPQTVTIAAAEDADAVNSTAFFAVASAGLTPQQVTATEADNDTQGLIVSTTSLTVSEGGTATFTVRLSAQPLSNTPVLISQVGGDSDLTVSGGANLTFNSTNWNTPQTVTIAAAEDADAVNGSANFAVSTSGLPIITVTATEADNDVFDLVVSTSSITVPEGGSATFTVRLSAQPPGDTVVAVSRFSGDEDLTVSNGASLTFTTANWNNPQTVTIAAAEDADAVNGTANFVVTATGLTTKNVTATETDNDTQGLVVSTTSVSVVEGSSASFTIRLAAQPVGDTTVTVTRTAGDTDLSITGGATLTFTTANWNTPQPVTIAAAEDADTINGSATLTVASTGLPSQTVTATEADNDVQGLVVSPMSVTVPEGGSATFTVRLSAQPPAPATVTVSRTSGDTDLTVGSGATLTFTTANWNTPQTVTLNAAEDADAANGTAVFTVASTGLPSQTVNATEADNDTLDLVVSAASINVPEGGSATFTVKLAAQPASSVTVSTARTAGDTDLSVSGGASLTFTTSNWNTPQTVTVSAAEDADALNGAATLTVSATGLASKTVTATEVDNDALNLLVSATAIIVPEGATSTFTVKLTAQPLADTVVTITRTSGDTDLTVSGGATLTFTTANWNTAQTVTIAAAEDVDFANGSAILTVASTGLTSQTVTATEADNDSLALVVSTTTLTVPEGGTATFTVKLSAQPTNTVSVTSARITGDTDVTVTSGGTLTFDAGNWSTPQMVTVSAAEDLDSINGTASILVSSPGLPSQTVNATENDNDTQNLVVSPSAVVVPEGGTATFTVKLNALPAGNVSVTVSRTSGDSDVTVTGGASLTFTTANWNTPQTVTLSAAEDVDAANGTTVITVASAGLTSQTVTATEADNDTLDLVVSTTAITVPEGGTATFTVRLSAQPAGNTVVSASRTSGDSDLSVSGGASLTFTTANWNTPQTVTLAAAEDADATGGTAVITISSTGLASRAVNATELDNDIQGIIASSSVVSVPEGGSASFTVRLNAQPAADVSVTVSRTNGDTDITVASGASLTFTPANWNVPQTVGLNAAEDPDALDTAATISLAAAGLPTVNVTATEIDNDIQGLAVSPKSLVIPEGSTRTVSVNLRSQPSADTTVMITRTGDSDLNVTSGSVLTFTMANWNVPQSVIIAAAQDADALNGTATFTFAATGLPNETVTATEADDETQTFIISSNGLTVPEGSTGTFTVKLGAQPTGNVVASVTRTSGDADLSVSAGGSLTFTTADWNNPQTVTIAAAIDADGVNGSAVFTVAATGIPSQQVNALEGDKDMFVALGGTYYGLIESDPPTHENAGLVTMKVTTKGTYSAKLILGGGKYSLKGAFDALGDSSGAIARSGASTVNVTLHIDTSGGTDQITGTFSDGGSMDSGMLANRAVYDGKTTFAPQAGTYTLVFTAENPNPSVPQGDGFANITVDARGSIKFKGVAGDGQKLKLKAAISKYGTFPVYIPVYGGAGSISGWGTFTNIVNVSDVDGMMNWFKPVTPGDAYYPAGFATDLPLVGSKFAITPPGTPASGFADAIITLGGGNLVSNIVKQATIDDRGGVTILNPGDDRLAIKISTKNGSFKGKFTHPVSGGSGKIGGVLLQKQDMGSGQFLGIDQAGFITIEPAP